MAFAWFSPLNVRENFQASRFVGLLPGPFKLEAGGYNQSIFNVNHKLYTRRADMLLGNPWIVITISLEIKEIQLKN